MSRVVRSGMSLIEFILYLFLTTFLVLLSMRAFTFIKNGLHQQAAELGILLNENLMLCHLERIVRAAPGNLSGWSEWSAKRCCWKNETGITTSLELNQKGLWLQLKHPKKIGKQFGKTERVFLLSADSASEFFYYIQDERMQGLKIKVTKPKKNRVYERTILLD